MADQTPDSATARVRDHRRWPAGVMPRHLPSWLMLGLAAVLIVALTVTGPPPPSRSTTPPNPAAVAIDANTARIEDYQRTVLEQAQRLAAEQAQLQLTKAAMGMPSSASGAAEPLPLTPESAVAAPPVSRVPERVDRVADNVAYSRTPSAPSPPVEAPASPAPAWPFPWPMPAAWPGAPPTTSTSAPPPQASGETLTETVPSVPRAGAEVHGLKLHEGTVVEAVLTNRIDGTFPGPVNALVSTPVLVDGVVAVPSGARVLGDARAVDTVGQTRLAVTFHRLVFPDGSHVDLDSQPALNAAGDLGLHDQVDRHYGQIFGTSIALGLVSGFAQARTTTGFDATGTDAYRQGVAANLSQSSAHVLDRFLNLLPTVTIREGHRLRVYLTHDLVVPHRGGTR